MPSWPPLGEKLALVDGVTGVKRSFADLSTRVGSLAAHLAGLGLVHGDRLALVSGNHPDFPVVLFAAMKLGVVVAPLNPTLTSSELGEQLNDACIAAVVYGQDCPQARDAADKVPSVLHVLAIGDELDQIVHGGGEAPSPSQPVCADDIAVLPYSSGTTGKPKGTMLSHRNLIAQLYQLREPDGQFYGPNDVLLSPLPMFHIYPLVLGLLMHLYSGHTYVSMSGRFSITAFCQLADDYKATRAHVAPPVVLQLAKSTEVPLDQLSTLKLVLSAAAPLYAPLENECATRLGCKVKQAWGMSELSPVGTMVPDDRLRPGALGLAVANTEIKLVSVDDEGGIGEVVPLGDQGEILIRGPQVMQGYLNAPQKTRECLSPQGWLRTGDVATMDDDGFLYIADRLKELIKYKGHQVAPAELEDLLSSHPKIADAAVIPVADEAAGELPRAYVVPVEGQTLTPEEVVDFVAEHVSAFKKLRGGAVITDFIPKSGSGKILRRLVVQQDRAATAAAAA